MYPDRKIVTFFPFRSGDPSDLQAGYQCVHSTGNMPGNGTNNVFRPDKSLGRPGSTPLVVRATGIHQTRVKLISEAME